MTHYYEVERDPVQMGGILSTLTFGLIGGKKKGLSRDEIMAQMASVVAGKLAARCMYAPIENIKGGVGHIIDQFGAWDMVLTDSGTVDNIADQTVSAMLASGVVTVAGGCANAGAAVSPSGTIATNNTATPNIATGAVAGLQAPISLNIGAVNPALLIGGGLLALIILKKGRHHARR